MISRPHLRAGIKHVPSAVRRTGKKRHEKQTFSVLNRGEHGKMTDKNALERKGQKTSYQTNKGEEKRHQSQDKQETRKRVLEPTGADHHVDRIRFDRDDLAYILQGN
ncbi:hypothetical protein ACLOJK_012339 [Asimina triloba]